MTRAMRNRDGGPQEGEQARVTTGRNRADRPAEEADAVEEWERGLRDEFADKLAPRPGDPSPEELFRSGSPSHTLSRGRD